ncbi:MAG: major facilitator superfamily domain-containing protein, partial [Olpidium bornovanus]
ENRAFPDQEAASPEQVQEDQAREDSTPCETDALAGPLSQLHAAFRELLLEMSTAEPFCLGKGGARSAFCSYCGLSFVGFTCYDIPAALNVQLQHWIGSDYSYYQWQLNLLYSVYSAPNVVLPVIGGLLVDRLGPARMLVGFTLCVIVGQSMFAWGVSTRSFGLMVFGRLVFGLGGESLEVAQARVTTDWFRGRGLGFALSLNLASARLATAVNDNVSPLIQELTNTAFASWFGAIVCVLSGVAGLWMLVLDRPDIRRRAGVGITCADIMEYGTGEGEEGDPLLFAREEETQVASPRNRDAPVSAEDASSPSVMFVDETDVNVHVTHGDLPVGHHQRHRSDPENGMSLEAEIVEDEKMRIADIIQLQPSFWVLCLICPQYLIPSDVLARAAFCCTGPWCPSSIYRPIVSGRIVGVLIAAEYAIRFLTTTANAVLQTKWYPGNPRKAGSVMSIPDIVSAIGSPMCGFVIDR